MTILDVRDFYTRRDAFEAAGDEAACTGCDKPFASGDPYSIYDLTEQRAPRAFPMNINLCQACTFLVMPVNVAKKPEETP
jgi:hypothetical protein